MNALFIGTRREAQLAFSAFMESNGYAIDAVTTEKSRISQLTASAERIHVLPLNKAMALRSLDQILSSKDYDVVFSAGFPFILPEVFLTRSKAIFINSHPHLLPEHKGFSPVRASFAKKEDKYGVSVHYMIADVDAGELIFQSEIEFLPKNIETLYDMLFAHLEPATILQALTKLKRQRKI